VIPDCGNYNKSKAITDKIKDWLLNGPGMQSKGGMWITIEDKNVSGGGTSTGGKKE
jgi:hypothetical protein